MIPLDPDAAQVDALVRACGDFVRAQLASIEAAPACDVEGADAVAATFREAAPERGAPIDAILARLAPAIAKSFHTASPGYMAFIPGGGLPAAALADWIALTANRYVGVDRAAPALVQIERTAIRWLADAVGYGPRARGVLTTGGSMSNFGAVVTAREAKLGERDLARGVVYASEEVHLSAIKAARLAGIARDRVRRVAIDARRRMDPDALARAVRDDAARGLRPFFVVASVGTTNTGAIDPVDAIAEIARAHDLWLHADGAYGGFFCLAEDGENAGASITRLLARCDSVTLDPHKGLFLPYGTGALLVADGDALLRAHEDDAAYLRDVAAGVEPSFSDLSPELSREARGLRLWLPITLHGLSAFRAALTEKLALTRLAYDLLKVDPRLSIVDAPQLSVVALRLARGDDAANTELLRRVNARGRVFLSSTVLDGKVTLRVCVLSFRTHERHVREACAILREEAAALA